MRKMLSIAVSLMGLAGYALAQKPTPSNPPNPMPPQPVVVPCPSIGINAPQGPIGPGETMRYSARVETAGDQFYNLEYKWSLNPPVVFAGQGAPYIEFERPTTGRNSMTIVLELTGLPPNCARQVTETASWAPAPVASSLDSIVGPLPRTFESRFNRVLGRVRARPDAILFIVLEHPTPESQAAAKQKGTQIAALIKAAGFDEKRVTYALGQTSRERVQFWMVPPGADYPKIEK